jgi:hypothetical protein
MKTKKTKPSKASKRSKANNAMIHCKKTTKLFYNQLATYNKGSQLKKLWDDDTLKGYKKDYRKMLQDVIDSVSKKRKKPTTTVFVSLRPKINKFAKYISKVKSATHNDHITVYPLRSPAYPMNQLLPAKPNMIHDELMKCYDYFIGTLKTSRI